MKKEDLKPGMILREKKQPLSLWKVSSNCLSLKWIQFSDGTKVPEGGINIALYCMPLSQFELISEIKIKSLLKLVEVNGHYEMRSM